MTVDDYHMEIFEDKDEGGFVVSFPEFWKKFVWYCKTSPVVVI